MNIQAPKRMTVDEYLVWAIERPGRFELIDGVVRQMSPETIGHVEAKHAALMALKAAIKRAGLVLYGLADGATVRVAKDTAFEPDALVYGPPKADPKTLEIPNPLIVVEVISPSTHKYDAGYKLQGYISLSSVQHVLLVNVAKQTIMHHRRETSSSFVATTVTDGILRLDPPGLEIPIADFFEVD
jgi:Uma2 family endonuclease